MGKTTLRTFIYRERQMKTHRFYRIKPSDSKQWHADSETYK